MFVCASLLLCACGGKDVKESEGVGTYTNESGEVTTAEVSFEGDKIDDVDIDETAKGKEKTKKELKDEYQMKQASPIKKEWYEQVDFFEDYVEKHGIDKLKLNADGKVENEDVKSGCTISVDGFVKAIENAKQNATLED